MKLNKRKCRKFADPGLKMRQDNGILHANQISYIVCTAVKIIDHHKTLILYIFPREQYAKGDLRPLWTVFQSHEEYITLAVKEDGGTYWSTAAFENLGGNWMFTRKCAFYSAKDAERVSSYFNDNTGGFTALANAQTSISNRRSLERQRKKEGAIISRMSGIKPLPRGLKGWIRRSVMPAYFFYDYKRGGNDVPGVCSACGHEIILSGIRQGVKAKCPHCKKELSAKPRSRRGTNMYDRDTCQVIENTGDGGIVVHIVKVYYNYTGDTPDVNIYENARQFVHTDDDGKICSEHYYYSYGNSILTNWKRGCRPVYSQWQYNFEADTCGHLYTQNLPYALEGTPWQFCQISSFYSHFHEPMQAIPFLDAHLRHPKLEHLIKTGFYSLVSDLAYGYTQDLLDEARDRTHQILRISAEDVHFLKEMDVSMSTLRIFQKYSGLKGRQEMLSWQVNHKVSQDVMPILEHMTPHKAMRYLDSQYDSLRKTPDGLQRYDTMQALVTEYRDYLDICVKLDYDLKNSFVRFPRNLQDSHDNAESRLKEKDAAQARGNFMAVYQKIAGLLDFEKDGLKIVYPDTPDDVIKEGHTLHHCVGRYVERVAKQECIILFLRQCSSETIPYYTIEIRGKKAFQVRGLKNCSMTSEVQKFITAWEQRVLSRVDLAA